MLPCQEDRAIVIIFPDTGGTKILVNCEKSVTGKGGCFSDDWTKS